MRRALLPAVLLAAAAAYAADAPEAAVSVDATDGPLTARLTAKPSDPAPGVAVDVTLDAELTPPGDGEIVWPDVRAALLDALGKDVVEVESARASVDHRSYTARLRLYDEGDHTLPPLTVTARRGAEDVAHVTLEGAVLHVKVDVPQDAVPAAARDALPLDVPPAPFPWWTVGAGAAVLAAAATLIARRRRRPRIAPPPPPPPPPHAKALAALQSLEARALPEKGQVEPYFVELSEILRTYLEERFGLRAPEQTTEEFLAAVSRTDAGRRAIESAHRDLLRDFLTRADMVKFARARPEAAECSAAGSSAERFVRETAPDDEPEEGAS